MGSGSVSPLHRLESPALEKLITRYPTPGPNFVEKGYPKYVAPGDPKPGTDKRANEGRVYISKSDAKTA